MSFSVGPLDPNLFSTKKKNPLGWVLTSKSFLLCVPKNINFFPCLPPKFIAYPSFFYLSLSLSHFTICFHAHFSISCSRKSSISIVEWSEFLPSFSLYTFFVCSLPGVMCDQQFQANPDSSADSSTSTALRAPRWAASSQPAPRGESTWKVKWPPGKGWGKRNVTKQSKQCFKCTCTCFFIERFGHFHSMKNQWVRPTWPLQNQL